MPKHVFKFGEENVNLVTVGGQIPQAQVKGSFNKTVSYVDAVDALKATLEQGTMTRENASNEMDAYLKVLNTRENSNSIQNAPFTTFLQKSQSSFVVEQIMFAQGSFANFKLYNGEYIDSGRYVIKTQWTMNGTLMSAKVYNFTGVVYRPNAIEIVENDYLTAKLNRKISELNLKITLNTMQNLKTQNLLEKITNEEMEQNPKLQAEVNRLLNSTATRTKLNWEVINNG